MFEQIILTTKSGLVLTYYNATYYFLEDRVSLTVRKEHPMDKGRRVGDRLTLMLDSLEAIQANGHTLLHESTANGYVETTQVKVD